MSNADDSVIPKGQVLEEDDDELRSDLMEEFLSIIYGRRRKLYLTRIPSQIRQMPDDHPRTW
jgi:hypothetical protein